MENKEERSKPSSMANVKLNNSKKLLLWRTLREVLTVEPFLMGVEYGGRSLSVSEN